MSKLINIVLIGLVIINGLQAVKTIEASSNFEQANINKINEVLNK